MRDVTENVVATLVGQGIIPAGQAEAAKEITEKLTRPDYIPSGETVHDEDLENWQRCPPGHRCGSITGNDIQSGPFYCGKPAESMAFLKGHPERPVFACRGHTPWKARHDLGFVKEDEDRHNARCKELRRQQYEKLREEFEPSVEQSEGHHAT